MAEAASLSSVLLLLLGCLSAQAYKILVVFPFPARSHGILGDGYVRHLLQAGHQVTYITPFLKEDPHPNLQQIDVSANILPDLFNITMVLNNEVNLNDFVAITEIILKAARMTLVNENVNKLIADDDQKFDVAVIEWLFIPVLSGFAVAFGCPYIWASSMDPHTLVLELIDGPTNPAYVPFVMSTNLPPFSFRQRVQEMLSQAAAITYDLLYQTRIDEEIYESWLRPVFHKRGRPLPPYTQVKYNASLVMGNSHPSLGLAASLPQSYKAVGGYHVNTDIQPLPENLKEVMNNAKEGVIYFSMGSNLKSKDWPDQIKRDLLKMFGELKQTVIWKFEEKLLDLPKNVLIVKWAPQLSILSHPNCVLFITHGGLLSTIEATHFGIPIIGIPVFADQFLNIDRSVNRGFAKKVTLSYNVAEELKNAIEDIMRNSSYARKAKELSLIYHDRPTPRERSWSTGWSTWSALKAPPTYDLRH